MPPNPRRPLLIFSLIALTLLPNTGTASDRSPTMKITSPAFTPNATMPIQNTCDGADRSPALEFSDIPPNTKSLALIIDDPDAPDPAAPKMTYVHWVVFNIPPTTTKIAEGTTPPHSSEGMTDSGNTNYGGPCPPIGTHRYFHKLYALDTLLTFAKPPTKAELEKAMENHIIGHAALIGTYNRSK